MLQPCRAGLGRNFRLINNLSSGNKKYMILPSAKGYTAPKSVVHFLSTGSHGMASKRLRMRMQHKVVRPEITRHSAKIALEGVRVDQNYRSLF